MNEKRFKCVGKTRLYDGTIASVKLIQFIDPEQRIRLYPSEYIRMALIKGDMEIDEIILNEDKSQLIFLDKSKKHIKLENEECEFESDQRASNNKVRKKVMRRKKSKSKYKRKK